MPYSRSANETRPRSWEQNGKNMIKPRNRYRYVYMSTNERQNDNERDNGTAIIHLSIKYRSGNLITLCSRFSHSPYPSLFFSYVPHSPFLRRILSSCAQVRNIAIALCHLYNGYEIRWVHCWYRCRPTMQHSLDIRRKNWDTVVPVVCEHSHTRSHITHRLCLFHEIRWQRNSIVAMMLLQISFVLLYLSWIHCQSNRMQKTERKKTRDEICASVEMKLLWETWRKWFIHVKCYNFMLMR